MLSLGPIAFTTPWVLTAFLAVPALWWLIRSLPPAPKRIVFPAIRLLFGLAHDEHTPAHSPLWLMILRAVLLSLVILALAGPLLHPQILLGGTGPLILVVDDGWASAPHWPRVIDAVQNRLAQAEREERPTVLVTTAPRPDGRIEPPMLQSADRTRQLVAALAPKPWPTKRTEAAKLIEDLVPAGDVEVEWFSDGLGGTETDAFVRRLARIGHLTAHVPGADAATPRLARILLPPEAERDGFVVRVRRVAADAPDSLTVRALGEGGQVYARLPLAFASGEREESGRLTLPAELRNKIVRLDIEGEASAAAAVLLDDRWRRRSVGLVAPAEGDAGANLLEPLFYLERALAPYAEVRLAGLVKLLDRPPSVMVLADTRLPAGEERERLVAWVEKGGVLLRFAGPRTADEADPLLPVKLRSGGRTLGGVLSWTEAMRIQPFERSSPFYGLDIPDDVLVRSQVLAEPSLDIADKTWARLMDGTPLVTAAKRGKGWIVLMHVTADPTWSDLPMSGLFVEMLRRILPLGAGELVTSSGPLPPFALMDGFGRLGEGSGRAAPIVPPFERAVPGPVHPPGYYGPSEGRWALNLSPHLGSPAPLGALPEDVTSAGYGTARERDLAPPLLMAAFVLALLDAMVSLWLRGLAPRLGRLGESAPSVARAMFKAAARKPPGTLALAIAVGLTAFVSWTGGAHAEIDDRLAALDMRLAYVRTGDEATDETIRRGLVGLTFALNQRTAAEFADPVAVSPEDDLIFYPLIYWVVTPTQTDLSPVAVRRVQQYLRTGGMILFDTRSAAPDAGAGGVESNHRLKILLSRLDLAPLVALPEDHVLRRTFYILDALPGRWSGGRVWVESRADAATDNVTSVVVGGNDWIGAWAVGDDLRPLLPVVPGGERQREIAYRFGINLVMHALTGNYKTDQVHVQALLNRMGE